MEEHDHDIPILYTKNLIARQQLRSGVTKLIDMHLRENEYEAHDSFFYFGVERPNIEGKFFSLDRVIQETLTPNVNTHNSLLMVEFSLSAIKVKYVRIVYTFWELLEDIGGICEVLVAMLGIFLYTYNEVSFTTLAISKFYNFNYSEELDGPDVETKGQF